MQVVRDVSARGRRSKFLLLLDLLLSPLRWVAKERRFTTFIKMNKNLTQLDISGALTFISFVFDDFAGQMLRLLYIHVLTSFAGRCTLEVYKVEFTTSCVLPSRK